MAVELAYAWITPYSLLKSRTGGIISRLLTLSELDLVGARMYAPGDPLVDEYRELVKLMNIEPEMKSGLLNYLEDYFRKDNKLGITNRSLLLLFEGEDAVARIHRAVGSLSNPQAQGDTVRGTYGDFIGYVTGEMKHFEPAVLIATEGTHVRDELRLFAKYADSDGGVIEHVLKFPPGVKAETTLVILKPDNFKRGSSRPGNIIDMFSRTGLSIVGAKMLRMSVAQAEDFYGPLRSVFVKRLKGGVADHLANVLRESFEFPIPDETIDAIADLLKDANAQHEFNRIVEYMTGRNPYEVKDDEARRAPGTERCLALLYRGPDAVGKIRECLGSTNPRQAAPGTVRSVYGEDLMKNGAHASDSVASAERERRVIGLLRNARPSEIELLIDEYLAQK